MPRQAQQQARRARSGGVALSPILKLLGNDLTGGVFTTAAAGADGELALHFKQRAGPVIHGIADLTITHSIADAHVHPQPLAPEPYGMAPQWENTKRK